MTHQIDERLPLAADAFRGARLHVVTGKGGVGKTTAAAALGLALARSGQRVLLCEVEGRQASSRLFGVPELGYDEADLMTGNRGGWLKGLAVEPRAALMDYLDTFYMLGSSAGRVLDSLGAVEFATTLAPGLRDVLLTGKVYEAAGRTQKKRRGQPERMMYDAVVVDAPPTGRIANFLDVSSQVTDLARVGPIHRQATSMQRMFKADSTRIHMVTLLEEMPVTEAIEGIEDLGNAGFTMGAIIANRVRPDVFDPADADLLRADKVDVERVEQACRAAGVPGATRELASDLLQAGARHATRVEVQRVQLERVAAADLPLVQLPTVPGGIDLAALEVMVEELSEQGVVTA